jgi:hypothetical protein
LQRCRHRLGRLVKSQESAPGYELLPLPHAPDGANDQLPRQRLHTPHVSRCGMEHLAQPSERLTTNGVGGGGLMFEALLQVLEAASHGTSPAADAVGLLSFSLPQSKQLVFRVYPSEQEIANSSASRVIGGARVALTCSPTHNGKLQGCIITGAQPDTADVRTSALNLATRYDFDPEEIRIADWSPTPVRLYVQINFPDSQGHIPTDCHPAFGCVREPPPPPPPLPPPVRP